MTPSGRYLRILRYALRRRWAWAASGGLGLLGGLVTLAQPWPLKILVDHALEGRPLGGALATAAAFLPGEGRLALLAWAALAGVGLYLASAAVDVLLTSVYVRAGEATVHDLATDLLAHLQSQSLRYHSQRALGDSMSRVTVDSWCAYAIADTLLVTPARALLTGGAIVVTMARLDPRLTLLAAAAAPVMAAAALAVGRPVRRAGRAKREAESALQAHVQRVLGGVRVVQAFAQERREQERFAALTGAAVRAQRRAALLSNVSQLGTGLATTLGTGAVLLVGAHHVLGGASSLGTLLLFLGYLTSLQNQLKALAGAVLGMQTVRAQVDRVCEVLESEPDVREAPHPVALARARGEVRVERVTFGYAPGAPVLREVTLEARAGETVAIVGPTGAGKSTLASLIPRLCDPWEGRVTLDGRDLRELRLADVRRNVAVVLQDPFLLPLTIAENITYGRPGATLDEVQAAARAAHAHEFVAALPDGYHALVGEGGATLSGGQRQRLAIARALLKDAPVLLLDEPTSALDAGTESLLLDALRRLMAGRTTFVIAHRLSTVRGADRIVVLDAGRVVERGTHAELLRAGGLYARLYALQLGAVGETRGVGGAS